MGVKETFDFITDYPRWVSISILILVATIIFLLIVFKPKKKDTEDSISYQKELIRRANTVCNSLNGLLSRYYRESSIISDEHSKRMSQPHAFEEDNKAFNEYAAKSGEVSQRLMGEYDLSYKTEAIFLNQEFNRILKKPQAPFGPSIYTHPTNPLGIKELISDLGLKAKELEKKVDSD